MSIYSSPMTTAPPRGFPESEYRNRTDKAQRLMADQGLAALMVCTEPEVRYFTGFHTPFWQSPARPWFVIVPATGKPVAVIPSIGAPTMSATWIDDVRTWSAPQPADDGVSLVVETIKELAGDEPVGLPMGHETHVRMPMADFDRLRVELGAARFVDATDIIKACRMVKSELEIAKLTHICSIVSDAFDALPTVVHTGMTEREAFAAFRMEILSRGADDVPYLVGATGPGGIGDIIKQPSDRIIADGDLLIFDTGSVHDGYSSDFDRNYAFTHATSDAKDAYRTVWDATEAALDMLRPGVTTTEVWQTMNEVLEAGGSLGNDVGRMGHGLGMQVTEWPSNTADDNTVIEENMVLTLEPGLMWAPGKAMVHEENLVVRAGGAELISRRAARELPII